MQYVWPSSLVAVLASLLAFPSPAAFQPRTRTVYVSATDKQGSAVTDLQATDDQLPIPQGVFYYLIRATNTCPDGDGTLGVRSDGIERTGRACP